MCAMMRCEAAREYAACPQTFEIRLKCPVAEQPALLAGLQRYGKNRIIDDGLLNAATVSGFGDALYFVITDGRSQRWDNAARHWKNEMKKVTCPDLRKLPVVAQVEWVRPFSRFSQRRFEWGDIQATKEEVVAAAREEDGAELLAIMPEAAPLVHRGELQQLPALFDALRSGLPAALADCRHQFFTEGIDTPEVQGPCGACGKVKSEAYKQGFTRCPACGGVRCKPCACDSIAEQDRQQSLLRAYHEIKNTHTWVASQESCDHCGAGPCHCGNKHCDKCLANVHTKQCDCGDVRCDKCLHTHVWTEHTDNGCTLCGQAPSKVCNCDERRCEGCILPTRGSALETWCEAHPHHRPATCYVVDLQRMKDAVKLEWLVLELGEEADIVVFARKFRELFGGKIGADSQKAVCLKLYRKYVNIAKRDFERGQYATIDEARKKLYSMECQVPPGELDDFEKVWDADAPRRCYECHGGVPAHTPYRQHFCDAACKEAGKEIVCTKVVKREVVDGEEVVHRCNGKVVIQSGCRVCTICDQGMAIAKNVAAVGQADRTELDKSLKRSAEGLRIANNILGSFSAKDDPDHVPAWTKRRRL